jgi:hypothetical protein
VLKGPVQAPSATQERDPVESHERVKTSPEETTNLSALTSTIDSSRIGPPERTACTHDINFVKVVSGAESTKAGRKNNDATTALEKALGRMVKITQTPAARIYVSNTSDVPICVDYHAAAFECHTTHQPQLAFF